MSVRKHRAVKRETIGVAEKVAWPAVALAATGVVLCVLDNLKVVEVDNTLWIALLGSSGATAGIGFSAPAAPVVEKPNK